MNFDPASYWESRLDTAWDLGAVGDRTMGNSFNAAMYEVRSRCFRRQVRDLDIPVDRADVLDIGSGTGFYLDLWERLGARSLRGSDLTPTAVTHLTRAHPDIPIHQLDISDERSVEPHRESCDVVSAYDVFFHIVDDRSFSAALSNIASLLVPGGALLFSDSLLTGRGGRHSTSQDHIVFRRLEDVRGALSAAGLLIVDQRPAFALMNAPVDSESWLRHAFWSFLSEVVGRNERVGALAGRLLLPIERRLVGRPGAPERSVRMFACIRTQESAFMGADEKA